MKHILISPGGSGTNFLYHIFGIENLTAGLGTVFNPHQKNASKFPGNKIMYISGHPLNILMSAERRGFFRHPNHVRHMGGNENLFNYYQIDSLEKYINCGKNLFDFKGHFESWKRVGIDKIIDYDWLDFEGKSNGLHDAIEYLQRNRYKLKYRQDIRPRTSKDWNELGDIDKKRLIKIHKEDIENYEKHIREMI